MSSVRKVPSPIKDSRNDAITLVHQSLELRLTTDRRQPGRSLLSSRTPREDFHVTSLIGRLNGKQQHDPSLKAG
jgi:hypothetical protein